VAPPEPELRTLLEDEHLLALDKPGGVVVHPVGSYQQGTLLQALHRRFKDQPLPKLAHRLDQFTSGVLLVAKSDAVRTAFSEMLESGGVHKVYEALLLGRAAWDEMEVDEPIGPVGDSRILMRVDRDQGKQAHSEFTVKERCPFASHVAVRIHTGRTHQIRVHAAHLGHPLIGDHLYGDGIPVGRFERFALHARLVTFRHPVTGAATTVEAPLPEEFTEAISILRG
jgi:23S rRNA pseudouridine1911/1915/1917 synthase